MHHFFAQFPRAPERAEYYLGSAHFTAQAVVPRRGRIFGRIEGNSNQASALVS